MPGFMVHAGATVLCLHAGQAQPTVTNPRVKLGGQPLVTQPAPYSIAGCAFPPPPAGTGPCVMAQWMTAALRVKATGQPVVLADSQAVCTPTGTGLMILLTQVRVKAQ